MKKGTTTLAAVPALKNELKKSKVGKLSDMVVKNYAQNASDGQTIVRSLLRGQIDLEVGKQAVRANGDNVRGNNAMGARLNAEQKENRQRVLTAERIVNCDGRQIAPGAPKLEKLLAVDKALARKTMAPVTLLNKKYAPAEAAVAAA